MTVQRSASSMASAPSVSITAQDEQTVRVCGEGIEADWLCAVVLERTGDEVLARVASIVNNVVAVVLILVGAYLLTRVLGRFVLRFSARMEQRIEDRLDRAIERGAMSDTQRFRTRRFQRLQAISGVMRGALSSMVWVAAAFLILARLGLPLQPVLAGAGLIGVLVGFGAQQLVRDILAGIAMLIEDQYGVGDWIEVDGKLGQVERVGLRSTAFRDVDGVVHHVLNGYVQRVGNLSQGWARATFDVPMGLDTDIPTAREIVWRVAEELTNDPVWGSDAIGPPEIWGVQHWGADGITIRLAIPTKPLRNWDLVRQLRERLKAAFDEEGIRMPSDLVDVGGMHNGFAVLTREAASDSPDPGRQRRDTAGSGPPDDATPHEPQRDQTAELRLQRGPQARPE